MGVGKWVVYKECSGIGSPVLALDDAVFDPDGHRRRVAQALRDQGADLLLKRVGNPQTGRDVEGGRSWGSGASSERCWDYRPC